MEASHDLRMWRNNADLKSQVGETRYAEMIAGAEARLALARRLWPGVSTKNLDQILDEAEKQDMQTRHSSPK